MVELDTNNIVPVEVKEDTSELEGLELRPVIDFYSRHAERILGLLPKGENENLPYPLESPENMHVTPGEINALLKLFPSSFSQRTELKNGGKFIGTLTTYFSKDSRPGIITVTNNVDEALSPTALATAYADSNTDDSGNVITDIGLVALPAMVSADVKKIIHSHDVIHEATHTITTHLSENESVQLRLPKGEIIGGKDFIKRFALIAEKYSPISHYASAYRKNRTRFSDLPENERDLAMEEELCEAAAAYLLGFVFSDGEEDRYFDPFKKREELIPIIQEFLEAEEINTF